MVPEKVRGIYLVPPHGTWIVQGLKKAVLKGRRFHMENEWLALVEDQQLLGVVRFSEPIEISREQALQLYELHRVSEEEIDAWWPDAETLYLYPVEKVLVYPSPISFDTPPGVQTFIEEVILPNRELLKSSRLTIEFLGVKAHIDRPGKHAALLVSFQGHSIQLDKGSEFRLDTEPEAIILTHLHPDHAGALKRSDPIFASSPAYQSLKEAGYHVTELPFRKPTKIGPFIVTAFPVLHSVKAPAVALRIATDSFAMVYAPDILGWKSREDRTAALDGASVYIGDGSHPEGVARRTKEGGLFGHAAFSTQLSWCKKAGIPEAIFTHLGEWAWDFSDEEKEELRASLEEKYGLKVVFAEPGLTRAFLTKLHLEEFRTTGIDYDLAHPAERWRELLADLRYLGNSAFPRLKAGERWGEWTMDDVLRYFGKIVDTLRSLYFPLIPPEKDDPRYNTPYWEAYRLAEKKGYIKSKPPALSEVKDWDKKRAELLKDSLVSLHQSLPSELLIVSEWACLTGSLIYGQHSPNDVDVVVKTPAPSGSLLKIQRAIQAKVPLPVQFSLDPQGPTWDYCPLYDLVAWKVPFSLVRVREGEEARLALYKASLITDPAKLEPSKPFIHYDVAGEFYIPHELELAWEKFARRIIEKGDKILVQPKFDGIRMHWTWDGKEFHVFTEKGLDVAHNFPGLEKLAKKLGKSFYLDCEFVEFDRRFEKQVSRTEMTWMATAKQPKPNAYIKIYVHDVAYLNGENLTSLPYLERLQRLKEILPKPLRSRRFVIEPAETFVVETFEEFKEAVAEAMTVRAGRSTEGAMVKAASFAYDPLQARGLIVKLKKRIEIDCLIIGVREMPKPKPPKTKLSAKEAEELLTNTGVYIARLALKDEKTGKLIPIESRKKLTEKDLTLVWDEEKQQWVGTDDPKIWKMFFGLPHRKAGEFAYGNSYSFKAPGTIEPGSVLCVSPMEITVWEANGKLHVSFQHPIPVGLKPPGSPVGTIQSALRAHGKSIPEGTWETLPGL